MLKTQEIIQANLRMLGEDRRGTQTLVYRIYIPAKQIKIPLNILVRLEKLLTPLDLT